jgi:glycosyltransferase involved in cell wall biosynthesis
VLSIVTINRDNRAGLERTLSSVEQLVGTVDFELIVADGGSQDGSVELIESRSDVVSTFIGGATEGITRSWNTCIEAAQGQHVMVLNSGDWLASDAAGGVAAALADREPSVTIATVLLTDDDGTVTKAVVPDFSPPAWKGLGFLHPGSIASMAVFERIGLFDPAYRLAADCDWFFRCRRGDVTFQPGRYEVHMENGGVSVRRRREAHDEYLQVLKQHHTARHRVAIYWATSHLLDVRDSVRRRKAP